MTSDDAVHPGEGQQSRSLNAVPSKHHSVQRDVGRLPGLCCYLMTRTERAHPYGRSVAMPYVYRQ